MLDIYQICSQTFLYSVFSIRNDTTKLDFQNKILQSYQVSTLTVQSTDVHLSKERFQLATLKTEFPSDAESKILLFLLKKGMVKKTELLVVATMHTIEKTLSELQRNGFIFIRETFIGRRVYEISLTLKGRSVAEHLKKAEEAAKGVVIYENVENARVHNNEVEGWIEKFMDATQNLSFLYHVNVFEDHVTISEDKEGKTRINSVYVKLNGKGLMRLWCESDESFECSHVKYAWTLHKVQEMYANNIKGVR